MNCRVRQIYYREDQLSKCEFEPYYNPLANEFLESKVILDLYKTGDHVGHDYYGVVSWRFKDKVPMDRNLLEVLMENETSDIVSFMGKFKMGVGSGKVDSVWLHADRWHRDFSKIGNMLSERLGWGVDVTKLKTPIVYYNYWIARNEVFEDFCKEMLEPALFIMSNEEDKELQELLWRDADYRNSAGTNLDMEGCLKVFGVPYYPYHPFVAERLISTYIALYKPSFKHLN